ncbi:MAG TPA: ATP-binding cassette domain-containing protein, partial [Actinomycetota bacterium]|nr:ATP-binding cassette domain-containing protein [Actinomycetota bacterium]
MPDNAIVVEGLVKVFGEVRALEGISFEVPAGTVFGMLGPNGAGKTTAIRILSTVLEPDVVAHLVAFARENLRMIGKLVHLARGDISRRATELLERFGLGDAADRPVRTYSGGMRRRL